MTPVSYLDNILRVGLLLREWRTRRGWSLRALGERSGVSYVNIARIEAGTLNPTVTTVEKLAKALGVSMRDIFAPERPSRAPNTMRRRTRR